MLPVVGTKEFIAWLPVMLGLDADDTVVYPELAYPTYDVGARLAGVTSLASDEPLAAGRKWRRTGPGLGGIATGAGSGWSG